MEQLTMARSTCVPASSAMPRAQKGVVLFIALIVLVALTLASIALVRSVDTTNVIAGNLAFKQGAVQAIDVGIETAATALPVIASSCAWGTAAEPSSGGTGKNWYYPTTRETHNQGVPTRSDVGTTGTGTPIDWDTLPTAVTTAGNNSVKLVIERLCQVAAVTDPPSQCMADTPAKGPNRVGAHAFPPASKIYYRVTVRVD